MIETGTTKVNRPLTESIERYGSLLNELEELVGSNLASRLDPILAPATPVPTTDPEKNPLSNSPITLDMQGKNNRLCCAIADIRALLDRFEI